MLWIDRSRPWPNGNYLIGDIFKWMKAVAILFIFHVFYPRAQLTMWHHLTQWWSKKLRYREHLKIKSSFINISMAFIWWSHNRDKPIVFYNIIFLSEGTINHFTETCAKLYLIRPMLHITIGQKPGLGCWNRSCLAIYYISWWVMIRMNQNSAIWGSTWIKRISAISRAFVLNALTEENQMFGKRVTHMLSRQRVNNWLNACISLHVKVNILSDFSPFCWTEPIPSCISILKTIKRTGLKAAFWAHRNHHQI